MTGDAVLLMTNKMFDLHVPGGSDDAVCAAYLNTTSRVAALHQEPSEPQAGVDRCAACKRGVDVAWVPAVG